MPSTTLTLPTGELELLDIPGDPDEPPLVLLHEGLGSVGLWRGFPERLAAATGRRTVAFSRYGHGQSDRPPKPRTPAFMHEEALEVLPSLFARLRHHGPGARRPQRRRVDRADLRRRSPSLGGRGDRAARVRRGDVPDGDPPSPRDLRNRRPAREDGPPPPRPRRRVLRLERRVARSGVPALEHHGRARANLLPAAADPGGARPVRDDGAARRDRAAGQRSGAAGPPRLPALAAD